MSALAIFRSIGIRGAIIGLLVAALAGSIWFNKIVSEDLKQAQIEIGEKAAKIEGLEDTVKTLRSDADRYQQQSVASYNAAQTSCDRRIEAATQALSAETFYPTPEVPPNAPAGTPPVCNCPSVRLRDVTGPFGID